MSIRQCGLDCTKETFITTALQAVRRSHGWRRRPASVTRRFASTRESESPTEGRDELRKFAAAEPALFAGHSVPSRDEQREQRTASIGRRNDRKCEEGDLNPDRFTEISRMFKGLTARNRH